MRPRSASVPKSLKMLVSWKAMPRLMAYARASGERVPNTLRQINPTTDATR